MTTETPNGKEMKMKVIKPIATVDLDALDFQVNDRKAMLKAWKDMPEGERPTWETFKRFVPTALKHRRLEQERKAQA